MEPSSVSPSWETSETPTSTGSAEVSVLRSASAPPKEVIDELLEHAVDPPNRFYRYPAARALLPILGRIKWLTPNHVTYIHILIGVGAAGIVAFTQGRQWLLLAFVLSEVRMILDCFDGVLARARGTSSPFGRALDEIGDTIGTITMTCAITHRVQMGGTGIFVACAMLAFGGLCANAWDFYKRKLTSALRDGRDGPLEEIRQKKTLIESGKGTALGYWGLYFDAFQILLYEVRPESGDAVGVIRRNAAAPAMKRFGWMLGLLSFDNGLCFLYLGVLTGYFFPSMLLTLGYCITLWLLNLVTARLVLRAEERAIA